MDAVSIAQGIRLLLLRQDLPLELCVDRGVPIDPMLRELRYVEEGHRDSHPPHYAFDHLHYSSIGAASPVSSFPDGLRLIVALDPVPVVPVCAPAV